MRDVDALVISYYYLVCKWTTQSSLSIYRWQML